MSATLGTLLQKLEPQWKIELFEAQDDLATESSNAWNNAGTGHAALCELNYMPEGKDGSMSAAKALDINEQYQMSRQWWANQVSAGVLKNPETFINSVPHLTFVEGEKEVDYLRRRYEILKQEPLFADMEYSEDATVIAEWAPLLIDRRDKTQKIAATRSLTGNDVNFGEITKQLIAHLATSGAGVRTNARVVKVKKVSAGWQLTVRDKQRSKQHTMLAKFVFVGAGGGALHLLQSAGIPEIKGFGGFPVSGKFLRCTNKDVIALHNAKVYGKAKVGAPPMSVPHLDTRHIDGKKGLLFGPYAGFTPNFLKHGSYFDLLKSIRLHNIVPMIKIGLQQWSLEKYLLQELLASRDKQIETLREYYPAADADDWEMITAGQRVQIMKVDPQKGAILQFGTEIVASADGTIAGLLGASPGASTAVYAMFNVLKTCFKSEFESKWKATLAADVPAYFEPLNSSLTKVSESLETTAAVLGLAK